MGLRVMETPQSGTPLPPESGSYSGPRNAGTSRQVSSFQLISGGVRLKASGAKGQPQAQKYCPHTRRRKSGSGSRSRHADPPPQRPRISKWEAWGCSGSGCIALECKMLLMRISYGFAPIPRFVHAGQKRFPPRVSIWERFPFWNAHSKDSRKTQCGMSRAPVEGGGVCTLGKRLLKVTIRRAASVFQSPLAKLRCDVRGFIGPAAAIVI
jgi:hypothetical protein